MSNSEPEVDWAVFIPAVIIVLVCAIPLMIFPESASQILADGRKIIMTNFLWAISYRWYRCFSVLSVAGPRALCSRQIRCTRRVTRIFRYALGRYDVHHSHRCQCHCVGALQNRSFTLQTPPLGIEVGSTKSFEWAHMYPLLHWGIVPWSMYALPAVPIAYMLYVKRYPVLRISSACDGALPKRGRDQIKTIIDILIVLGIVGGVATSLGLGGTFTLRNAIYLI